MSRSTRNSSGGFTLIEVVVTMAVLSVVLASIGALVASTVRGVHSVNDHLTLVNAVRAIEAGLGDRRGLKAGTTAGESAGQRWRVDVAPYPGALGGPDGKSDWAPMAQTVTVEAANGTRLSVTSLRLRPKTP